MLDSNGLYWDSDGSYKMDGILSAEGMRQFFNLSDCVIIDYALPLTQCTNMPLSYGNNTLGEDLADLLGVEAAYWAYFNYTDTGRAGSMADIQHWHMIFAQVWCSSNDHEQTCAAINNDVHALPQMRVDLSLRNMRHFQRAFGCFEGQPMYKPFDQMCRVFG
jgi:predicted metalloendopeptidase